MTGKKKKSFDVAIGVLLVSFGLAGLYAYQKGSFSKLGSSYAEEANRARSMSVFFGSILDQKGNVRFRFNDSAVWHEMEKTSDKVNFGDALFTAKDGHVLVQMLAGEKIELLPNSLVIMKKPTESDSSHENITPTFELKKGHLKVTFNAKGVRAAHAPILIEVHGKTYQIKESGEGHADEAAVELTVNEKNPEAAPEVKSNVAVQIEEVKTVHSQAVAAETLTPPMQDSAVEMAPPTSVTAPVAVTPPSAVTEPVAVSEKEAPAHTSRSQIQTPRTLPREAKLVKSKRVHSSTRAPAAEVTPSETPSANAVTTVKPEMAESSEYEPHSLFSIAPLMSFSRIDSHDRVTNSHSVLGSDLNLGAEVSWRQFWTPHLETALILSAVSERYQTTDALRSLDHNGILLGTIAFESRFGEDRNLQIISHLGGKQMPFLRGESAAANILDAVTIPFVGLGLSLPIKQNQVFSFNFAATADYLSPSTQSNYSVNSGYDFMATLTLEQRSKRNLNKRLQGSIFYEYANQGTSITTQNISTIGANLKWSFDLFGDDATPSK